MKKFFNILLKLLGILTILILIAVVLMISSESQKIPDIVISSSNDEIMALRGNYTWNTFSEVLSLDTHMKDDYIYKNENSLLVTPSEKISIKNPKVVGGKHYFEQISFSCEDSNGVGQSVQSETKNDSIKGISYIEFSVPQNEGIYYYFLEINYFEKGQVEYSFKVVVSQEPTYDILSLVKYKNTSLVDAESIQNILSILPYSRNVENVIIKPQKEMPELDVYFNEIVASRSNYINNAIALFTLIPELEIVSLYSSDNNYNFLRLELEKAQGRSFSEYVDNPELWEQEIVYKQRVDTFDNSKNIPYVEIIKDVLNISSGDKINYITIDTKSFQDYTELGLSDILREKLLEDVKAFSSVVFDTTLDEYKAHKYAHTYIGAEQIESPSGDVIETTNNKSSNKQTSMVVASGDTDSNSEENKDYFVVKITTRKNNIEQRFTYNVGYINGEWIVQRQV